MKFMLCLFVCTVEAVTTTATTTTTRESTSRDSHNTLFAHSGKVISVTKSQIQAGICHPIGRLKNQGRP